MGYLYDKVKLALGGNKFSSSHSGVVSDWSPNSVKALFITRGYIIVVNHVKVPKLYKLDVNESSLDISKNGSGGALHNLLSQRQLSCMEEIYVDAVFNNYKGMMDLQGYVNKTIRESSRLRYYGYIDVNSNPQEIVNKYTKEKMEMNPLYAYATDKTRSAALQYYEVGNKQWYKNYNLRPQYYKLDADNGLLDRWFRKSESKIEELLNKQTEELENKSRNDIIHALFVTDVNRAKSLKLLMELYTFTGKRSDNDLFKAVHRSISSALKNVSPVKGFRVVDLQNTFKAEGCKVNDVDNYIISSYAELHIFDSSKAEGITFEELVEFAKKNDGFLLLTGLLEDICCRLWSSSKRDVKIQIKLVSVKCTDELPEGKFSEALGLKVKGNGSYSGYLDVLLGICGFTVESFLRRINRNV